MQYKNDLEMWHKYVAEHLKKTARFQEIRLINQCIHYFFDNEAFEEYCKCPKIKREKDFNSENECWNCEFYEMTKVGVAEEGVKKTK